MRLIIVSSLDIGYDTGHGVLGASNRNVISCHELIVDHVFCRYADDGGDFSFVRSVIVTHRTIRHRNIADVGIFCPTNRGRAIFSSLNGEVLNAKVLNDCFETRFLAVAQFIGFLIPYTSRNRFIGCAFGDADDLTEQAVVRTGGCDCQIADGLIVAIKNTGEGVLVRADGRPLFVLEVDVCR